MKKRTLKEWRRLVSAYERGGEGRRGFCERHGVATSTLDYWRRRARRDESGPLVEVEMETGGAFVGGQVPAVVIMWPSGVRVELEAGAASEALLSALHGAFGGGGACSR